METKYIGLDELNHLNNKLSKLGKLSNVYLEVWEKQKRLLRAYDGIPFITPNKDTDAEEYKRSVLAKNAAYEEYRQANEVLEKVKKEHQDLVSEIRREFEGFIKPHKVPYY